MIYRRHSSFVLPPALTTILVLVRLPLVLPTTLGSPSRYRHPPLQLLPVFSLACLPTLHFGAVIRSRETISKSSFGRSRSPSPTWCETNNTRLRTLSSKTMSVRGESGGIASQRSCRCECHTSCVSHSFSANHRRHRISYFLQFGIIRGTQRE